MYPIKMEKDGIYFRICRDNKYENICFTDLTKEEQKDILSKYNIDEINNLCYILTQIIRGEITY